MIFFIVAFIVFILLIPRQPKPKQIQQCEKHQWEDLIINNQCEGLICKKCFKRPG